MLRRILVALLVPALLTVTPSPAPASEAPETPEASAAPAASAASAASDRGADPRLRRELYVSKQSQAYRYAQTDHRFDPIGLTPMAHWVTREWFPIPQAKRLVRAYARKANRAGRTPVVTIYAVPARDCGGYADGGWDHARYRTWITRVAAGLRGRKAMAILEPDALGHLGSCSGQGDRTGLLRFATRTLTKAGVWVYIDAAHHGWIKPNVMARRLIRSGVGRARGYSVNVASFVRTDVETRYAERIHKQLRKRGVGRTHYVMDTSRNGGGQTDGDDWCNPLDARLGQAPRIVAGRRLDAYLWVKAPGESDGPCNGGPSGGAFWPEYALRLMGQL